MKKRFFFNGFLTLSLFLIAFVGYSQCVTPPGDQTTSGDNYWIGYSYQATNDFNPVNYFGYFNEATIFDESFCGATCSFPINGCPLNTDSFTVRFKMTKAFTCGDYTFTIGGDDGVRLSIDGAPYLIDDYSDHAYRTNSATVTLTEGNHNLILDYYENNGGNRVSFSYAPAAGNINGPGVIGASQLLCQSAPFDPVAFTSLSAAAFCSGTPTYKWQSSTDQFTWADISGAISTTYDVPSYATLGTIYYRRSADNGIIVIYSNTISVITGTAPGDPAVFGNGVWNAYSFNSATAGTNYYGFYTENNLSFNTQTRWANTDAPSNANNSSGSAFSGCGAISAINYTVSYKRTNFACNYYQIDIPAHDDDVTLLINGSQVFQHLGCCDAHASAWTGFLGASSNVEVRFTNFSGPGGLRVNIIPSSTPAVSANTPSIVCSGSNVFLTATSPVSGVGYSWAPDANNPNSTITTPNTNPTVAVTPQASGDYIVTITDPVSGCTAFATVPVTVAPTAATTVSASPTLLVTDCPSTTYTLSASGAASYIWSADTGTAGGLSATTGYEVTATPLQTTTYTVFGFTGCNSNSATITITVNTPAMSTFPTNTWNVYGFDSQTIGTNYRGYYTENGSAAAPNTYSFDTRTRWADGASPATANATNGTAWVGCTMNNNNISLSFKRSGFTCGIYQLDVPAHDDDFLLFIDGVSVASHLNGCCDSHTNIWTGPLSATSRVEWQLKQGGGGSYLQVLFTNLTQPASQSTWIGNVSTDWFNAANWCGGIPSSTTDVLIPAGAKFMPSIATTGAQCKNIIINAGLAATTYSNSIAAASLTTATSNNLDVFGNWVNNGSFIANTGSVTFRGATNTSITSGTAETFYNLIVNKSGTATLTIAFITQQISNNITFTNGIVIPNATLEILSGATATGASNVSYVEGPVKKTGTNSFTYPVGKSGFYRPISISAPSSGTDSYIAEYFYANSHPTYPNTSKDGTLDHIGGGEYWMLNRVPGSSNVMVTLSWASTSGIVDDLASLRVAGWNGTTWKDLGSSGTTGNATAGTVSSASVVSVFGPFVIASANANNPLPITLLDFTCVLTQRGKVNIRWSTLNELNNDYFHIERSIDGQTFRSFTEKIKGAGTSMEKLTYATEDKSPPSGKVYYRLKQVDFDGVSSYSVVRMIQSENLYVVEAYPNPADHTILIDLNEKTLGSISVVNSLGVNQHVPVNVDKATISIDSSTLSSGLYLIRVVLDGTLTTLRVIVSR